MSTMETRLFLLSEEECEEEMVEECQEVEVEDCTGDALEDLGKFLHI